MLPSISVITPIKPDGQAEKVMESPCAVDFPADRFEVLVAEGTQPSKQQLSGLYLGPCMAHVICRPQVAHVWEVDSS